MAETKQIRVSELVHTELQSRKREEQTFDDVLREVLGLVPDFEDLLSYYSDEQQDVARELVSQIESVGDFDRVVRTSGSVEVLRFISKNNGRTIATIEFDEKPSKSKFTVSYRNQRGDLEKIGDVRQTTGEELTVGILGESGTFDDPSQLVRVARERIEDAYEAWG
jgi:predicted CopG family antitoxin